MKIGNRQQFFLPGMHPTFPRQSLTGGTVAIVARIVLHTLVTAMITPIHPMPMSGTTQSHAWPCFENQARDAGSGTLLLHPVKWHSASNSHSYHARQEFVQRIHDRFGTQMLQVQINQCGLDRFMTQQLFDRKQINALLKQMCGKTVTQRMHRGFLADASSFPCPLKRFLDRKSVV